LADQFREQSALLVVRLPPLDLLICLAAGNCLFKLPPLMFSIAPLCDLHFKYSVGDDVSNLFKKKKT
jgi:hypothetical protein